MTAQPVWFDGAGRPAFGWLHAPDDATARAGVLVCQPLGYEGLCAQRTMRELCERLARRGFAAFRFDYDGTGDAAGDDLDPGRVAAWHATVRAAAGLLESIGVPAVAAVGMRLGATLAATARPFDALVLWDAVWNGRRWVRQTRALQLVALSSGAPEAADRLEVPAAALTEETLADLGTLGIDAGTATEPVLVLVRDPADVPPGKVPARAVIETAEGQSELLDVEPTVARTPVVTIERICGWLDASLPAGSARLRPLPSRLTAEVAPGIRESARELGSARAFAIETAPEAARPGLPTVIFLNAGTARHIGPNRLWVTAARRLAGAGFVSVRVDLLGLGDSPPLPDGRVDRSYPPGCVAMIQEVAAAADRGDGVVLAGLCSGGRFAVDAGVAVGARGVCTINANLSIPLAAIEQITVEDPVPAAVEAYNRYRRYQHHVLRRVPAPLWRMLDRAGLVPARTRSLQALVDRGIDTLVVYGEDEHGLWKLRETAGWALAALEPRDGFRLAVLPVNDHSFFVRRNRDLVEALIVEHLAARFAPRVEPLPA